MHSWLTALPNADIFYKQQALGKEKTLLLDCAFLQEQMEQLLTVCHRLCSCPGYARRLNAQNVCPGAGTLQLPGTDSNA